MSWKNVKENYRIGHIVHVTEAGICIGSPYIHDLIVIGLDGNIKKRNDGRSNEDLRRYLKEMDSDPEMLKRLVVTPDTFGETEITVYTYQGGEIVEKKCEEIGWPNVTKDGDLMYENTWSTDKAKVVERAKRNARIEIKMIKDRFSDIQKELSECEGRLLKAISNSAKLDADYPSTK